MTYPVTPTQEDRALFRDLLGLDVTDDDNRILRGDFDNHPKMLLIAQHAVRAAERMREACLAEATARREMAELHMERAREETPGAVTIQTMAAMVTACEHIEERIRAIPTSSGESNG